MHRLHPDDIAAICKALQPIIREELANLAGIRKTIKLPVVPGSFIARAQESDNELAEKIAKRSARK